MYGTFICYSNLRSSLQTHKTTLQNAAPETFMIEKSFVLSQLDQ